MSFANDEEGREQREFEREKRRRRHMERLGIRDARCFFCGEDDVRCLHLDHVDGREFSDVVWPICANCHAKRTDLQTDHPAKGADRADPLEQGGRHIEGFADYLEMAVTRLRELAPIMCAEAAARSPRHKRHGDIDDRQRPSG